MHASEPVTPERAVLRLAREAAWRLDEREILEAGTSLRFQRDDLRAVVYLWSGERAVECRRAAKRSCAHVVMVEGVD